MWNLILVHLEIVLDRSMVCAKCTIGSKSFWTHLMVLLDDKAQVEARFGPFEDITNLDPR
jgi:predicted DsbA family dithiol-disulfide isomerase